MATQQTLVGMGGEEPALYDFGSGTVTWTSNSRHGRNGPSLSDIRNGMSGANSGTWKWDSNWLNSSQGIALWTVPQTGTYRIETFGPRGSNSYSNYFGGYGTRIRGDFNLIGGEVLKILVGQTGADSYGGGGGMTGVAQNNNTPLIFSGGGNCTSPWSGSVHNATTSTSGQSGGQSGGSGGNCGYSSSGTWGGAGFYQNYSGNANCGNHPYSFTSWGQGGYTCNGQGGYGGGTGSDGCCYGSSGAGGGYSGGGGGTPSGGGGGSYNGGSNQSNTQNGSNWGSITIQKLT